MTIIYKSDRTLEVLRLVCEQVITLEEAQEYLKVEVHQLIAMQVVHVMPTTPQRSNTNEQYEPVPQY